METMQFSPGLRHDEGKESSISNLRICDIVQFHSPISGGIKRYITDKAKMLRDFEQIEHCIIIPGEQDLQWNDGATMYYQIKSPLIPGSKSYRSFVQTGRIKEILDEFNPDLIEVADPYQSAWTAMQWAKQNHARIMLFYHSDYPRAWHRTIRKWAPGVLATGFQKAVDMYLRHTFEHADALLVSTEKYERYWKARIKKPVLKVRLGFDPAKFHPHDHASSVRKTIGVKADAPLILFLGRLAKEKRIPILIEAFEKLKSRIPDTELLIVGDGEEQDSLLKLCERKHLKVHWLPFSSNPATLASYYTAADAYAHPAKNETFGLSVLEALACGTPVVAFHQSGLEEACRNSPESILVREGDIDAFAHGIERALERKRDFAKRMQIHEAMKNKVSLQCTIDQLFAAYLKVYTDFPGRYTADAS